MVFAAAVFVLVFGIVMGTFWAFVLRPEQAAGSALLKRVHMAGIGTRRSGVSVRREPLLLSSVALLNRLLSSRSAITAPVHRLIEQSGVRTTVGVVLLAMGCFGMLGFVVGQTWRRSSLVGVMLGLVLGGVPYVFLAWKRSKRVARFEELFPEALTLMTRAMRAGHTFVTALGMVADELPQPISGEFRLLHDRQNFGLPITDALRDFGQRIPVLPAKFFATAVLTQRETGGNLSEVLENLASVIRDRFTVLRQVKAKSAHGRMTGLALTALPPAAALLLSIINPGHFRDMLDDPFGMQMVIVAVILQIVGGLIIRKLVNIDY